MKKYQNFDEIYPKNLENHRFLVYHPSSNGHVTGPYELKSFENCFKSHSRGFWWHLQNYIIISNHIQKYIRIEFLYDNGGGGWYNEVLQVLSLDCDVKNCMKILPIHNIGYVPFWSRRWGLSDVTDILTTSRVTDTPWDKFSHVAYYHD